MFKQLSLKPLVAPRIAALWAMLGVGALLPLTPVQAFTSNCDGPNSGLLVQQDLPGHTGEVTFGGAGKTWSYNNSNVMICTGYQTADHAQAQGPLAGPKHSTDFSNTFTFAVKFVSTQNATSLNQIFFQVFEKYGTWSTGYAQPDLLAVRNADGTVTLSAIHQSKNANGTPNDADNDSVNIGNAPMDIWLKIKVKARFTLSGSTSYLGGRIVPATSAMPADSDLIAVTLSHGGLIYQYPNYVNASGQSQYNPDSYFPYVGNYTWPISGFTGTFVGTTNIDEYTQLYDGWGYNTDP